MSNTNNVIEEGNNNKTATDQLSWKDEVRAYERGKATVLWYSPPKNPEYRYTSANGRYVEPEHAYLGGNGVPTWEEPIADIKKLNYNLGQLKSAHTNDIFKVLEDPFKGEWKNIAREYADVKMAGKNGSGRHTRQASIGTEADFSAIDVVNVMANMVGTELRTFVLEQALTTIGTPQLDLKVDTYTRFTAQQGVPEGVAPIPARAAVSRTSYDLTKDVSTIGITDEAQLRTVHDLYRQQVDTAVTDFKRLKSNKIATKLATASSDAVASGTWAGFTTDHNTNDPRQDIGKESDIIFANNGAPNIIASHDAVWRNFASSTFIKGTLQAIPMPDMSMAKIINQVPSMPGFTWYVDNEMTATIASIFDRKAVAMLQGPVRTAQYRLELEGIDGYLYRDWSLPVFLVSSRVRQLTGAA